ncbi:hypothetical protein AMAG_13432 [Allomyces macrogynus ATCC 38327]|uniref:Uncharacterized protein n=1 Tax=Allomyces macrogynus (strain ATCC 38327) TaxID=578462 RepID=A0A0L0T216_ALLM3|nr:hypothetical protein AMAG_13432 [Allomyces macrogynus ATCC 38327]|eukprot:KNE68791.1 hypothetical protein AMAG_13432 [Allomyces macrogynus ATCC 38327]
MFITPTHIVIGPLTKETLSLVSSAIIEIVRNKHCFDLLQLSVLCDHPVLPPPPPANDAPYDPDRPRTKSAAAVADEFDVVLATVAELRALDIPVARDLADLVPEPTRFASHFAAEPTKTRAPVEWLIDVAVTTDLAKRRDLYAHARASGALKKVCYVRPKESIAVADASLLDHEVLVRYGALAEDLPYIPLVAAPGSAFSCPVRAATAALYPASLSRRTSALRLAALGGGSASSSTSELPAVVPDPYGRPQVTNPVVYPIPLISVMHFLVTIVNSRFIYDHVYTVTGAAFKLPGVSPVPLPEVPLSATRVTPPPSPSVSTTRLPSGESRTPLLADDASMTTAPVEIDDVLVVPHSMLDDHDDASIAEHLQHLHDHAHAAHDVHLASLVTASGRTLAGIAAAFQRGDFSKATNDYVRALHQAPPAFVVMKGHDPFSDDEDEGMVLTLNGGMVDSGVHEPSAVAKRDPDVVEWDEALHGSMAEADLYTLGGGRFTVAVRAIPPPLDHH